MESVADRIEEDREPVVERPTAEKPEDSRGDSYPPAVKELLPLRGGQWGGIYLINRNHRSKKTGNNHSPVAFPIISLKNFGGCLVEKSPELSCPVFEAQAHAH